MLSGTREFLKQGNRKKKQTKKSNRLFAGKSEYREIIVIENYVLWSSIVSGQACISKPVQVSTVQTQCNQCKIPLNYHCFQNNHGESLSCDEFGYRVWKTLSRRRWSQQHSMLSGCAQTLPCWLCTIIYSSSLQLLGKEGNTQDMHWKWRQGIWDKSFPCHQKVLVKGRSIGLHRVCAPAGSGLASTVDNQGITQGPISEEVAIREQVLPLPLSGMKDILLSRDPRPRCHWRKSESSIKAFNEGGLHLELKETFY